MLWTQTLVVVCALSAADSPVLLEFTSSSCPACVQAAPAVERLTADGYPVRQLDMAQHGELAARYGVEYVPTFVLVDKEREIDRVVGPASYARLARMFESAAASAPQNGGAIVRGQSPDDGRASLLGALTPSRQSPADVESAALAATVKLTVDDPKGRSHGTGTIIDIHGDEALVVTCGHIFRDSAGRGQITAQLFVPGASGPVPGQLIAYDADDRDIGLVSIRPGVQLTPAKVASSADAFARGDAVFSIGCDHGAPPTVRRSQITAIDKYQGAPNIEVAGQPVDGRSGGGLFTADGALIGICNAADPQDDEGLYAALATVHWQLDQIGQQRVYQQTPQAEQAVDMLAGANDASGGPARGEAALVRPVSTAVVGRESRAVQSDASGERYRGASVATEAATSTEVICIVRSRNNPHDSETILVQNPSAELLQRIEAEAQRRADSQDFDARLTRNFERPVAPPRDARGEVVRGQSDDRY